MNTDTLMSSLREMIKADIRTELAGFDPEDNWSSEYYNKLYSYHETVVRKGLQELADLASSYIPPTKLR